MEALMGKRPKVKARKMLTTEDLRILLKDIDFIGRENALALLVILATCVRGMNSSRRRKKTLTLRPALVRP
jgi:hypothetical protein